MKEAAALLGPTSSSSCTWATACATRASPSRSRTRPDGDYDVLALVEAAGSRRLPGRRGAREPPDRRDLRLRPGRPRAALTRVRQPSRWDLQIAAATERLDRRRRARRDPPRAATGGATASAPTSCCRQTASSYRASSARPTEAWLENTDLQGPVVIDPSARLALDDRPRARRSSARTWRSRRVHRPVQLHRARRDDRERRGRALDNPSRRLDSAPRRPPRGQRCRSRTRESSATSVSRERCA